MVAPSRTPADTTIMGVVHDALRRDLVRTREAVGVTPPPGDAQRVAIADHLVWMLEFLHHHHESEDAGLWPVVRARNPEAAPVLDRMSADHEEVEPLLARALAAARRYRADAAAGADLLAALDELSGPLLAHLAREEDEAMPVVAATLSQAEWRQWDREYNPTKGRSIRSVAMEGHWLMDGLDPARYAVLVGLVPAPVRVVLVRGFARAYRTECARRWGPGVPVGPAR
ncbi:MAG TPA: hemerythrin domain-containing protein [Actinoplanes sp.]|nr:hemerythrin domain-containing protein [Actinoplanes sp.]